MKEERQTITGNVKAVSDKGDKYAIQLENGLWYNGWGKSEAVKGDTVQMSYIVNGTFNNVKVMTVLEHPKNIEKKEDRFGRDPKVIVRTDCLRMAVDMLIAGKHSGDLYQLAERHNNWIEGIEFKPAEEFMGIKVIEKKQG